MIAQSNRGRTMTDACKRRALKTVPLIEALRQARVGLPAGGLFPPLNEPLRATTLCLLLSVDEINARSEQAAAIRRKGYLEGLDTDSLQHVVRAADQLQSRAADELLLKCFRFYWKFDKTLQNIDAADVPSDNEVIIRDEDRKFYESLGPERERADHPCGYRGCSRGAIRNSTLCRSHHFQMIRRRPYPLDSDEGEGRRSSQS
jgi:hypothetical protein